MPSCGRQVVVADHDDLGGGLERLLRRALGDPARAQVLGQQQRVDAPLLEAAEHVVGAGRRAAAGAQALLEPVEQLALAPALVLLDPARGLGAHLVDARVLDADADVAREALLQVRVQLALEVADGLVGRADQELLEALALEQVEDDGGGVGEVVADVLVDRALVARLRPAALLVLGVHAVLDPVGLLELLGRAGEDAGDPPVGEQHAPEPARERLRQRLDVRRVVDHHARLQRAPDPHRLEQARRAAGEDGDGAGAVVGDVGLLEHLAHGVDVGAQRHAVVVREVAVGLLHLVLRVVHQRA